MKPILVEIAPNDFDFSGVPPAEKPFCCHYEYLRESYNRGGAVRMLIERLVEIAANAAENKAPLVVGENLNPEGMLAFNVTCLLSDLCFGLSGFPEKPWMELPLDERLEHFALPDQFRKDSAWFTTLRLETHTDGLAFETWKSVVNRHPGTVHGWFMIRPGSRKDIIDQFRRELQRLDAAYHLCTKESDGGADTPTAQLRALGAFRLLANHTAGEALNLVKRSWPDRLSRIYKRPEHLRRAAHKGQERLREVEGQADFILKTVATWQL